MTALSQSVQDAIDVILLRQFSINAKTTPFTIHTTNAIRVGDNQFGTVLRIEITLTEPEENTTTTTTTGTGCASSTPIYLICKTAPTNYARRVTMNVRNIYKREAFMYASVLPEFANGCAVNNGAAMFIAHPQCYHTDLTEHREFIVLEDLRVRGFTMHDRRKMISYDHARLALEQLAHFHAMSFVLRVRRPHRLAAIRHTIREDILLRDNMDPLIVAAAERYIAKTIVALQERNMPAPLCTKLSAFKANFKAIMVAMVSGGAAEPYAVVCHGDFWNNNLMYRYDADNNPVQAYIVDFQMARYASPILDIVFYLFGCTHKRFRDLHFERLKQAYYDALAAVLANAHLNVADLFPRIEFERHFERFGLYGLGMAMFAVPYFISESGSDFDSVAEKCSHKMVNAQAEQERLSSTHAAAAADDDGDGIRLVVATGNDQNSNRSYNRLASADLSELLTEIDVLTVNTLPIFEQHMVDVIVDMDKYRMWTPDTGGGIHECF